MSGNSTQPEAEPQSKAEAKQSQAEAKWQESVGGEWKRGSLQEAVKAIEASGKVDPDRGAIIVLLSDALLTSGITICKSIRIMITSYASNHPYTIKNTAQDTDGMAENGRIFTVKAGQLFLRDIILDGGRNEKVTACHPLICVNGQRAFLIMHDGAVLQNAENVSKSFCGGGINIRRGQVFIYDGAKVMHCKAKHGGGIEVNSNSVYMQAVLGMAGGSIEHCEADNGGGVYVNSGMFQMRGGEITDNRAAKEDGDMSTGGGGIYVAGQSKVAAVRIVDGKIIGNEAPLSNGGGILVQGGYALLQIEGGILERNTAKNGGGISVILGTLKLYGGTVTANNADSYGGGIFGGSDSIIEMQGSPKVSGNTSGDTTDRFDNMYLDGKADSKISLQYDLQGKPPVR